MAISRWILGFVLLAALAVGASSWWTQRRAHRLADAVEDVVEQQQGQQKITSWEADFEGACLTHSVVTTKGSDETTEEFCARHHRAVRTDLIEYPPKEGSMHEETR